MSPARPFVRCSALAAGAVFALVVWTDAAAGQKGSAKGNAKILKLLEQAKAAAEKAPGKYNGHRAQALVLILAAVKEVEAAGKSTTKAKDKGKTKASAGQGAGQMQLAMRHMEQAIVQLEAGLRYYQAQRGAGATKDARDLSRALALVTKAMQLAQKKK